MPEQQPLLIRRVISLCNRDDGLCVGWLEDNFHHLGVTVRHHAGRVTGLSSRIVRYPWTTCAETGGPLRELVGTPLRRRPSDLATYHAMRQHCTHLFELAALIMAQAASGRAERRYDARIWSRQADGALGGTLTLNGNECTRWTVASGVVLEPATLAGQSLVYRFRERLADMDDEAAEFSWILRRAFWLAEGDLGFVRKERAQDVGLGPVCYTFLPEHSCRSIAKRTSRIDINAPDAALLELAGETP